MSLPDDYEEDMRPLSRFSDRELDGILAGRVPAGGDDLEDLVQHLQALRAVQVAAPGPEVESHHLALVAEAVSSLRGEHLPAEI
ncbi:MAG: hypothetical protein QOH26_1468, partial [Actinomycetota bacterium]|nr:hypothetical protein [Actinomycetota bacterium]